MTQSLMVSLIPSSIGLGYFVYGKKTSDILYMFFGIILMIYPYLVTNLILTLILGILFCILPYYIKKFFNI